VISSSNISSKMPHIAVSVNNLTLSYSAMQPSLKKNSYFSGNHY